MTERRKDLKIEVTVRCINEYDNTGIYSCNATYCSEGNTLVQSEVDDYTKTMASDALQQTSTLLKNQIKTELFDETTVELRELNQECEGTFEIKDGNVTNINISAIALIPRRGDKK